MQLSCNRWATYLYILSHFLDSSMTDRYWILSTECSWLIYPCRQLITQIYEIGGLYKCGWHHNETDISTVVYPKERFQCFSAVGGYILPEKFPAPSVAKSSLLEDLAWREAMSASEAMSTLQQFTNVCYCYYELQYFSENVLVMLVTVAVLLQNAKDQTHDLISQTTKLQAERQVTRI